MNEIVKNEERALISEDDFDFLIWFDEQKKRAQIIDEKVKERAREWLENTNTDSYKQTKDGATIHVYETKPYKKKQTDTKKMKEEGVYDLYTRDVWVKGSIRIQVEYEDE